MKNQFLVIYERLYRIAAVLLLLGYTASACQQPASTFNDSPQQRPVYDINPPSGVPGTEYFINIISRDPNRKDITGETQLFTPGSISVSNIKAISNDALSAKITIPKDTPLGRTQFLLKDKEGLDGKIIGTAEFEITSLAQGPIPNGLSPEVDVMWGVMAEDIVEHNFGHKIAKHYYGIQLTIGNNTGFDLQLAGVGFRLPAETGIKNTVPTNSYRSTRGTLEKQQQVGTRAKIVNSLKAFGLVFTGFLPFWQALGPSANAAQFADIINGPLTQGLELIYPDTIISQLTRLDDQMLRDGLIIKNNSQIRTLVFVPKQLLNISTDEESTATSTGSGDKAGTASTSSRDKRYYADKKRQNKKFDWRNDPQYVNLRLGELVIIGQAVKFLNRIQVIKSADNGPVAPPPTLTGINPPSFEQGSEGELLTIPGSYLDNATLTLKDPDTNDTVTGVKFADISSDSSGHILKAKIIVGDDVEPKKYWLVVSSPGGSSEKTLEIIQAPPSELSEIVYVDGNPPTTSNDADKEVKIKITGKHLENAKIVIPAGSRGKLKVKDDAEVKDDELTQTIILLKGTPKGSYGIQIQNSNPKAVDIKFVVNAAPAR